MYYIQIFKEMFPCKKEIKKSRLIGFCFEGLVGVDIVKSMWPTNQIYVFAKDQSF